MLPAARLTDNHVCPIWTGVVPHIGGPIVGPGAPTVLIGALPAATMGTMVTCTGPPDSTLATAVAVLITGKPACRLTDSTVHGGVIVGPGCPTVLIGGPAPPAPSPAPGPPEGMSPDEAALMMQGGAGGMTEEDLEAYRACVESKMSQENPPPREQAQEECKKRIEGSKNKG